MNLTSTISATIAVSFFALAASSANAADVYDARNDALADPAPAAQADVNWSGLWIGAVGGMNFFNTETDFNSADDDHSLNANIDGLGAEGFFGEAQLGYDQQVSSNIVLGIFGGLNLSDAEFNASVTNDGNITGPLAVSTDYEWGGVAGLRLGLLKSQSTMFYVAGGYAYAELGDTLVNGDVFASGPDLDGWFGEIGMETQVTRNVFLTVSGRYTDYGSETLWSLDCTDSPCDGLGPLSDNANSIEVDTDSLAVMVGLKAKFGGL